MSFVKSLKKKLIRRLKRERIQITSVNSVTINSSCSSVGTTSINDKDAIVNIVDSIKIDMNFVPCSTQVYVDKVEMKVAMENERRNIIVFYYVI